MRIQITDVYLRDGLQDEPVLVPTAKKLGVAQALVSAGVKRLEVASFVNPARVPQMGDAVEILAGLEGHQGVSYTTLALNGKGIVRAVAAGATNIQVVTSASQAHSNANAGNTIGKAMDSIQRDVESHPGINFFSGISTAFTCPFEGDIEPAQLLRVVRRFKEMGITEIGLADTLGTTPTERLMSSVKYVQDAEPDLVYSLHLHNAKGQAIGTVLEAVKTGIVRFDSALGGYGGCPFAPGAHGNIATETLVAHLHASGHDTGIDERRLADAVSMAREMIATSPGISVPVG